MLLLKQPPWNHIVGRARPLPCQTVHFKIHCSGWSQRLRETERDVTCIAFLQRLSGFTGRLIQPITSFPLSSTIAANAPIVSPSEKVILRCQVQHRKWLRRRSGVWLWQAWLPASMRLTSERMTKWFWGLFWCQPCRTRADQRRKSIWHRALVVVLSCKNRVLFNLTTQNRKLLNHWGFQNSMARDRKERTRQYWRGRGI